MFVLKTEYVRKRSILISFFVMLLASLLAAASPLKVEFAIVKQKAKEGIVTLNIINTAQKPLKVLKWNTPFEKIISADIFKVDYKGKTMPYIGRVMKRGTPKEKDYIVLKKGESRRVDIDIANYYEMPKSGLYSIAYMGDFRLKETPSYGSQNRKREYAAGYILYNPTTKKTHPYAKVTNYNGCSSSQRSTINSAHSASIDISLDAKNAMSRADPHMRQERYVVWFGEPDSYRQQMLKTHFNTIYNDLNTKNILFDCSTCTEDAYAYVYPSEPYIIYLCGAFWTADLTGMDSMAGTIVHEVSHFVNVADTDDYVYGTRAAQELAKSNPATAIKNADNHEYFAENTPILSMDRLLLDPFEDAVPVDLYHDLPLVNAIENEDDSDYYTFVTPVSDVYTFYTVGDLDTLGTLYDSDRNQLIFNDDQNGLENTNFKLTYHLTEGERYYLKIDGYGTDTGAYILKADFHTSRHFAFLIPAVYSVVLVQ